MKLCVFRRYEGCAVAFKGRIVSMLGRDPRLRPVSVYDPFKDVWTSRRHPPFRAHHVQCVADGDRIVIGGGFGSGRFPFERPLKDIYEYYPNLNKFNKVASIPKGRERGSAGLAVYRGKWYLVNGNTLGHGNGVSTMTNWFDCYDPKKNVWTKLPNSPKRRDHTGAVVARSMLFVMGGQRGGDKKFWMRHPRTIDVYDFEKGTWRTLKQTLQFTHGGVVPAVWKNVIVIAGGEYRNVSHGGTEIFNVRTMRLRKRTFEMKQTRHGFQMAALDGIFYAAEGAEARMSPLPKDLPRKTIESLAVMRRKPKRAFKYNTYWG